MHAPSFTLSHLPARMPLASNALLSTGQDAVDFNRPLSFDTSKVTTMYDMFNVSSARALHPRSPFGRSPAPLLAPPPTRTP